MNIIKHYLVRLAEKITGRKCSKCLHNVKGRCCHLDGRMFMRCWSSIRRPGFSERGAVRTIPAYEGKLTTEEQHLLQKIQGSLDNAETAAREAGLLED